jgi:glycosyltransferase involved in cell wall biosynthesis
MQAMISVLLPVYNEAEYLVECLESVLAQEGADFEVCISDNASTDATWEIITRYSRIDSRIKPVRHQKAIHPFDNFTSALYRAKGDYVYIFGGDDYLLSGFFKKAIEYLAVIPDLQGILVRMHYFSDKNGDILSTLPPVEFEENLNTSSTELVSFLLRNINHDEVFLGIFRLKDMKYVVNLLSNQSSLESVGLWLFIGIALLAKNGAQRIHITDDVYLMKRYEKSTDTSYSRSAEKSENGLKRYMSRIFCSIINTYKFYTHGIFNWREVLIILCAPRYHSSFGFEGFGPLFDPFWLLIAYPVRKIKKAVTGLFAT